MIAHTGRIWEAASNEPSRPILTGVFFDAKEGTLTATDSYIMAQVPCEVEEGDVSGIIPADALKTANGKSLKVTKQTATLSLADGERSWKLIEGQFPDTEKILAAVELADAPFGLNPDLLKKVAGALGVGKYGPAVLHPVQPLKPMFVGSSLPDVRGVVMPVRLSGHEGRNGNGDLTSLPKTPDLSNDERLIAAVNIAAAALNGRRGKKRAAEAFRKALAA